MTKRPGAETDALHAGPGHRQGNGLAHAGTAAQPNAVTPTSRTGGPATPGGPPAREPRLDAIGCHVIASGRQAAVKHLNL